MKKKNKSLLSMISLACLTLVAGTFAWTSFNQRALNEDNGVKDARLAEGRVHDDYSKATGNKDVYAENYGDEDLIVRLRLSEYFENDGTPLVAGTLKSDFKTWTPYVLPEKTGDYRDYVSWTLGGDKIFLPTFNTNNQSESVDVTGDGIDRDTGNTGTAPGTGEHNAFTANQVVPNPADPTTSHTAKKTLTQKNGPITMAAWKSLSAANKAGDYWVIDTDGWAYWANPLKPTEATSLLLNDINIDTTKVSKLENWYYGIDVHGQFATLDDTDDFGNNGNITQDGKDLIENIINGNTPPEETFTYKLSFTSNVSNVQMETGASQTFGAKLEKTSSTTNQTTEVSTGFTWSVTGGGTGTSITSAGRLTIGANDHGKTLTVKVVSTEQNLDKTFSVKVKEKEQPVETFTYKLSFTSNVSNVEMDAGSNQTFGAKVEKTSSLTGSTTTVSTPLTWTVTGGSSGTSISTAGKLTVAAADGDKTLTVKVTNAEHQLTKSFSVTVKKKSIVAGVKPGEEFKFNNEAYLYLKDLGDGNHLILRKFLLPESKVTTVAYHGSDLDKAMKTYYNGLSAESKAAVQTVQTTFKIGMGGTYQPGQLTVPDAPKDFVTVTQGGEKKAFALSANELSDVSGPGKAFPTVASRGTTKEATPTSPYAWLLRTPDSATRVWFVHSAGQFSNGGPTTARGVRPALVIHQ